ncbi:Zinc finger and BTB domain-containing protein 10 [Heterocephalus glaber]|uniref:Zinc finger and BTB domain-containing protein 10 n=1 Tax=Heterocephalus glaber TaxID=10181 RepID=G5B3N6_HETGA|nr:Zinc finger and BTB domain-containing protein 10 [Heterocephalus glaber]
MQPPVAHPEENKTLTIKPEPDLDGALFSGPDGVNASLLAEAWCAQDGGDAGTSHDYKYGLMPGLSSDYKYGLLPDCADKSQAGGQEGVDQGQDTEFLQNEEYEENKVREADEELIDDGEDENDPPQWDESEDVCVPLDD